MENNNYPKNWAELKQLHKEAISGLGDTISITNNEANEIMKMLAGFSDGSGAIEACIKKYPKFVGHVRALRTALAKLNVCYRCMNDHQWLKAQPEWNIKFNDGDEDDESTASGGLVAFYSTMENQLNLTNAVNMNVKMVMDLSYNLQHGQNKFYNQTAIQEMSQKLAKTQQQVQQQAEEMVQGHSKNMQQGR